MIIGKRHPLTEMRRYPRPGYFTCGWLKPDGMPFARFIPLPFWPVFGVFTQCGFLFAHSLIALPHPVHDRGVISHQLALFIISMTGLPLIAQLHFYPVFNIHDSRLDFPIAFAFTHNLKLFPKPIDGFTHKLIRADRLMNTT